MTFMLTGPMVSGKNQISTVYRGGKMIRFPNKRFKAWRDAAVKQLMLKAWPESENPKGERLKMTVIYTPGDAVRRDLTGMLDALFHLLEYGKIVENDYYIKCVEWHDRPLQRNAGSVVVTLEEAQ